MSARHPILVIKQGALGDVIMATALLEAILARHATDEVHLLTAPAFSGLFAAWPRLRVTAFPRQGLQATWRTLRWVRQGRFRRVYDLQGNDRSGVLCALSGIPERVGNAPRFPYNLHPAGRWQGETHIFERMVEVLRAAGVTGVPGRPILRCSQAELDSVAAFLEEHALGVGSFAVLHAGASPAHPEKRWPGFADLAPLLRGRGLRLVWLGGPDDGEQNKRLAGVEDLDATGRFSIPQLAALAARARFAVTNDSGPMHACAAAGIPVFALFGPSDWRRNHALGQAANVIAGVELLPDLAGRRTADCLARITPQMVVERLSAQGLVQE